MYLRLTLILLLSMVGWSQRWELKSARNLGALADGEAVAGISVRFARSAAKQVALEQFLQELHRPGSPEFHKWLQPEEFASRFGLSEAEVGRVERWLGASGFAVKHRSRTRTFVTVSGNARAVRRAFSTELRRYEHKGKIHFANATAVSFPAEVADLVQHVDGLDDFLPEPNQTRPPEPEGNIAGGRHVLAPDDYAVIYSIKPALARGIDGTGQRIAVVGQSNIDLNDMRLFRSRYRLAANEPDVILYPGSANPGFNDAQGEANLDLQWAGAVARNAKLIYVYGTSVFSALAHVVDQRLAPIVSVSFSAGCELQNSQSALTSLRNLAQAANALGITWVNSSGDGGPAGCDANSSSIAQNGFSPRVPSIIPEVTSVGGTELNDRNGNYWNATNDENQASALSYIPEIPWNESRAGITIASGGGGISAFFPRPSWQEGPGVGNEQFRKSPDVALAASTYNGYSVITNGSAFIYGGTSAGTPAFAGMLALVLQATNQTGLGNVNRLLYPLAQSNPEAFQDISSGSTRVPCAAGSKDCNGINFGYEATPGYDMATGLGSIHFENLLNAWPRQQATRALVTLSSNRNPVYATSTNGALGWAFTLTLKEHAGVSATITSFKIDGENLTGQTGNFFGATNLNAAGSLNAPLVTSAGIVGTTRTIEIAGEDANGNSWTQTLFLPFLGLAPTPTITGIANGASFLTAFAPGSVISVFGRDLAAGTQAAAAVPLIAYSGGISATVDGVNAPFYYVSPGQINLQIPYATQPGTARLTIGYPQGGSASVNVPIQAVAPGIFTNTSSFTVPQTRCGRGETCILYITGQGAVSPAIATGAAPALNASLAQLPRPVAPVSMTIGEVPAEVVFAGIPYGLVGVMQINFTVAAASGCATCGGESRHSGERRGTNRDFLAAGRIE
jgi:uncharacterized protein (TIGR03437 family)